MGRADQWVHFRWIFHALVWGPAMLSPWVNLFWRGFFWEYVGLCALLAVSMLGVCAYVFGLDSIFERPSEVEDKLEAEDESHPETMGHREMSAAQLVAASDRSDGNRPPDS